MAFFAEQLFFPSLRSRAPHFPRGFAAFRCSQARKAAAFAICFFHQRHCQSLGTEASRGECGVGKRISKRASRVRCTGFWHSETDASGRVSPSKFKGALALQEVQRAHSFLLRARAFSRLGVSSSPFPTLPRPASFVRGFSCASSLSLQSGAGSAGAEERASVAAAQGEGSWAKPLRLKTESLRVSVLIYLWATAFRELRRESCRASLWISRIGRAVHD